MNRTIYLLLYTYTIFFCLLCKEKPSEPIFNNPLDRRNPDTQGDPFELQVSISEGGVKLHWIDLDISTITGYNVYRSEIEGNGFLKIGSTAANQFGYLDKTAENGHNYWYKVTAFTSNNEESSQNNSKSVKIEVTGILNHAPIASFTVTPDSGDTWTNFIFDASTSNDYENDVSLLQVKWDWENNGVWDTNYSTTKIARHQYTDIGIVTVKMGVIDTGYLTDIASQQVTITQKLSITDIDGNIYKIVKIGTQWWMAENLKSTKYRNGDPIPNVTSNSEWTSLATGAYCNYNNDLNNVATYGRLYNWYTVNDSRNITPAGWHVPSNEDWQALIEYLGGSAIASEKMKESGTSHWNSPNTGTNESGFSALPGGYRNGYGGYYYGMSNNADFWSSTEFDDSLAWYRDLYYNNSRVYSTNYDERFGFSVRCVRDE